MTEVTLRPEEGIAEFNLPEGCPACGGPLAVRVNGATSWGYCPKCHWLGKSQMAMRNNELQVTFVPGGVA
jgi:hypothetical protein